MSTRNFYFSVLLVLALVFAIANRPAVTAAEIDPNPGLSITANVINGYDPDHSLSFVTSDPSSTPARLYGWKDGNYGGLTLESNVGSSLSQIRINVHDGHLYNSTIVLDSKLTAVTNFLRVNKGIGIGSSLEPTQDLTLQMKERPSAPTPAAGAVLIYYRNGALYVMFPNGVEKQLANSVSVAPAEK